ncbi:hypothetical protein ACWT_6165 [Actinoplanes sp. SE50]|uniref:hypothetical protein n=1 Tax=unclassified Actinoplanes TaxID=2626549 RepID=UPI00023ECD6A|nr:MULTISPECIES: hypothetical protein [unclassified Actinoplanes]AEV87179.1 hypothetical protein ACPL_6297 [Actinoplanes sp. SE50/110]ATO85580.1 hypothetical protein ACWT_6165 [Actinoplanes sp. SE50]SLM02993.1 hypothetical protein ACSP50_6278 [Actinoplanes sp. SE50/110]
MSIFDLYGQTQHLERLDPQGVTDFVNDELIVSDIDSRQALEDLAWMTAGLFSDGNGLAQLYIDDGWDVTDGSHHGLTEQQRGELIARLGTIAHNCGQLVAELCRRASAVKRESGWDPLVTTEPI